MLVVVQHPLSRPCDPLSYCPPPALCFIVISCISASLSSSSSWWPSVAASIIVIVVASESAAAVSYPQACRLSSPAPRQPAAPPLLPPVPSAGERPRISLRRWRDPWCQAFGEGQPGALLESAYRALADGVDDAGLKETLPSGLVGVLAVSTPQPPLLPSPRVLPSSW